MRIQSIVCTPRNAMLVVSLSIGLLLTYWLVRPEGLAALGTWPQWSGLVFAATVAAIPTSRRACDRILAAVRNPSQKAKSFVGMVSFGAGFVYLIFTALRQRRDLFPRLHDECSYTLQARMLAEGLLWLPQHPMADFFETFHVLVRPVYASIYFPGTALMNVPGVWLTLPSWCVPVFAASLTLALCYLLATELYDGVAGILCVLLLLANWLFRVHSTMVMSQVPVMLLGTGLWWAWLRWRRSHAPHWLVLVGALSGWAIITRPVDGVAFVVPVLVAIGRELWRTSGQRFARSLACVIIGAIPFMTLQATLDRGTTGSLFETPYVRYLEQNQPGAVFGSNLSQRQPPESVLPQKREYHAQCVAVDKSRREAGMVPWAETRLRQTAWAAVPFPLALTVMPAWMMLGGKKTRRRWVMVATVALFLILYSLNPLYLNHYGLPLTPVATLAVVGGAQAIERALPHPPGDRFAAVFFPLALGWLAITSLPEFDRNVSDEAYDMPLLRLVDQNLQMIQQPAVVFFRYSPGGNVHEEPVYNLSASWPDDARIVRAHDLGTQNGRLLRYYATRQPQRTFYLFDRRPGRLYVLGSASDAAALLGTPLDD